MKPDIPFGEGDKNAIRDTILDATGARLDLTGATVMFRYRDKDQTVPEIDAVATATQTTDPLTFGDIEWTPPAPMPAGDFNANWIVTFPGATPITFPNDRYLWLSVLPKP